MSDLKPVRCECGKRPVVRRSTKRELPRWRVECDCGRCGPYDHTTQGGAVCAWNTRPPAVPVEALEDIYTRWSENLLDDWEVCIEIRTLIDQARGGGDVGSN